MKGVPTLSNWSCAPILNLGSKLIHTISDDQMIKKKAYPLMKSFSSMRPMKHYQYVWFNNNQIFHEIVGFL